MRVRPFPIAGGAKPIAAMQTDAGCLAAAWGGLEGFTPPHEFKARTATSDGQRTFTRAARQRRAQVCGEVTVQRLGQGKDKVRRPGWHLIHRKRSPFPSIGEGLNAREAGRVFECRVRYYHARRAKRCREIRRGEAHRRRGGGLEGFTPPHH